MQSLRRLLTPPTVDDLWSYVDLIDGTKAHIDTREVAALIHEGAIVRVLLKSGRELTIAMNHPASAWQYVERVQRRRRWWPLAGGESGDAPTPPVGGPT